MANASVQIVPAMVERAAAITAAQRARGLDTEGERLQAASGACVPIVGPVVLGAIGEVEERTMALEARGFTPARPPDAALDARATRGRPAPGRWCWSLTIALLLVLAVPRACCVGVGLTC